MDAGMKYRVSRRRIQPRTACDTCRRRKSRCNVSEEYPCSICAKRLLPCRISADANIAHARAHQALTRRHDEPLGPTPEDSHASSASASVPIPIPPLTLGKSRTEEARNQGEEQGAQPLSQPAANNTDSFDDGDDDDVDDNGNDTSPTELRGSAAERDHAVDDLVQSGLSQFYRRGVDATRWTVFGDAENNRLAYVGTDTSNLAHLIGLKPSAASTLHFPYPQIRPPLPWKPEGGGIDVARDTACFPSREIRDALVDAFFERIFPVFPVVDEALFRHQYRDRDRPPPLLVFQAVLLAGAHVCDHPTVAASRVVAKRTLYRRASMLFHMQHENDRLHMVQAALLFTWHLDSSDTVCGGSYYWLGVAQRIALGMGMHRDLSSQASSRLPAWDKRMYRRVWWTLVQAEALSCLETGRPCMVHPDDTDQPMLELRDLAEGVPPQVHGGIQLAYILQNSRLALLGLRIVRSRGPSVPDAQARAVSASIEADLAEFAFDLPPMKDFWSCQLRIHYNLLLLHLKRARLSSAVPNVTTAPTAGRQTQPPQEQLDARDLCSDAAQAILSCMETIVHRGWAGQCSFTAVSAVTAAAIQMAVDARASLSHGSPLMALNAQDRLTRLLHCARELAVYWPNAGAVHGLFQELAEEMKMLVRRNRESAGDGLVGQAGVGVGAGVDGGGDGGNGSGGALCNDMPLDQVWDNAIDPYSFAALPIDLLSGDWVSDAAFLDGSLAG